MERENLVKDVEINSNTHRRSIGRVCLDTLVGAMGGAAVGAVGSAFFAGLADMALEGGFFRTPADVDMFYKWLVIPAAVGVGILGAVYGAAGAFSNEQYNQDNN